MRRAIELTLVGIGIVVLSGCRTATRVAEVPRVDLEVQGGNQGYPIGTPPASAEGKATRQMVQTDIEVPSFYRAKHGGSPVSIEGTDAEPTGISVGEVESSAPVKFDSYVVQKGESLWTIAAKREIYGKATQWRRIFEANHELLKSPDRVRAGMTLKIPRGGEDGGASMTYSDEGITYKK